MALANDASLSPDYVNKLELGRYTPSADTLVAIARALDVRLDEIVPVSTDASERGEALDELCAVVSRYRTAEIRYLVEVIRAVMLSRSSHPPDDE